jgi:hypothetical protein
MWNTSEKPRTSAGTQAAQRMRVSEYAASVATKRTSTVDTDATTRLLANWAK